jgi:hypothetical protein
VHADCWGTPDVAAWVVPGRRLRVLDYKFGHGFVDAYENWQLMAYAAGLLEALEPGGDVECIVELTVVQPRNYHRDGPVRTWTTTGGKLRTQINIMANACDEAAGPNPGMHVGPECKHCPAARACPQLQAAALDACDLAQKAIPLELPNAAAGLELQRVQRALKLLEARASGLEAQVVEAIKRGEQVPRWHLEAAEGRESWSIPLDEVKALGMLYGAPVTKEVPITPNQARKLGVVTDGFSQRPRGASKLVPDGNTAARVFGG